VTNQRDRLQGALSGRYAIERELGRGGMATVYLAGDMKHHMLRGDPMFDGLRSEPRVSRLLEKLGLSS
jgi:hypothetical protein